MKRTFDAICWDNDGLLVDTEKLFFETTRQSFFAAGFILSKELWSLEYLSKGRGTALIAQDLGMTPSLIDDFVLQRNLRYRAILEEAPPLRPKVVEVLRSLAGRIPMAMVTGSKRGQALLVHRTTGLLEYFSFVIAREDYERAKPEPDSYLTAASRLGIPPACCLAVEDSKRGLSAAVAAGMTCIVVPNALTQDQDFSAAHAIEADVAAVLSYL